MKTSPARRAELRLHNAESSVVVAAMALARDHRVAGKTCDCRVCASVDKYRSALAEWAGVIGRVPRSCARPKYRPLRGVVA